MSEQDRSGVRLGNISGGITGSIIAGRDVSNAVISVGGRPMTANQEPTVADLVQLLADIQEEIAAVETFRDALAEVSPAAPFTVQGAAESVKEAAQKASSEPQPKAGEAESIRKRLEEATSLLGGVLDGAKALAAKAGAAAEAIEPLVRRLLPLVEKVAVAALWVDRLWISRGGP